MKGRGQLYVSLDRLAAALGLPDEVEIRGGEFNRLDGLVILHLGEDEAWLLPPVAENTVAPLVRLRHRFEVR